MCASTLSLTLSLIELLFGHLCLKQQNSCCIASDTSGSTAGLCLDFASFVLILAQLPVYW